MLRRAAPGVVAKLEHELERLWAANEQRQFDLRAATRGTMLSTQAATLAALRRLEAHAAVAGSALPTTASARRASTGATR